MTAGRQHCLQHKWWLHGHCTDSKIEKSSVQCTYIINQPPLRLPTWHFFRDKSVKRSDVTWWKQGYITPPSPILHSVKRSDVTRWKQSYIRPLPHTSLASSVKTKEVKVIECHRIRYIFLLAHNGKLGLGIQHIIVLTFDGLTSIESSCHSQCHMFCTAKHRPILRWGKNIASILMKTQATSSTSKLCVLPSEPAINTGCQLRSSDCHNENGGV